MKKSIMAALAAAVCATAGYAAPSADFDKGVDAKAFLSAAKEAAKQDKAPIETKQLKYRAERDCATFSFAPDGPTVSDVVWLRSTEYDEVCDQVGDPRHGGGRYCREVPRYTNRERVQLELQGRQALLPWEREVFEVCLEGRWLNLYGLQVGHDYKANRVGGHYTLSAGARKAMNPDAAGITADAPVTKGQALEFTFKDRWASYYAGEKTKLKLTLKREVEGWFDPTLLEKELELDAAGAYTVDFNAWVGDFKEKLKPGKKYYVDWSFTRVGKVSKPTEMKQGDSPAGAFAPAGFVEVASLY